MAAPGVSNLLTYFAIILYVLNVSPYISAVKIVKETEFKWFITNNAYVLVYFYDAGCSSTACKENEQLFETLVEESSHSYSELETVKFSNQALAKEYGIPSLPKLVFFRKSSPTFFMGQTLDTDEVTMWLEENREPSIRSLFDDDFEHLTQAASGATTGDWLIIFHKPECSTYMPIWETVAGRLKRRLVVAGVDIEANKRLQARFQIKQCPAIYLFRLGTMYEYNLKEGDYESLVAFAEGWYKNTKSKRVPSEATPFDNVVDMIVDTLKSYEAQPWGPSALGCLSLVVLAAALLCVCCCQRSGHQKTE